MRVELLPGLTNVIRFPLELRARPSLELMRELAPDVREVMSIAEAFGMDLPSHDLRARVDEETAAHIAAHLAPSDPPWVRAGFLDKLLDPLVAATITACREVQVLWTEARLAQDAFRSASSTGKDAIGADGGRVDALVERAVTLLLRPTPWSRRPRAWHAR